MMGFLMKSFWLVPLIGGIVILAIYETEAASRRRLHPDQAAEYSRLGRGIFLWLAMATAVLGAAVARAGTSDPLMLAGLPSVKIPLLVLFLVAQGWMLFGAGPAALAEHPTDLLRLPRNPRTVLFLWCVLTIALPSVLALVVLRAR